MNASAGVRCLVKPGEPVEEGQPLLELHADDQSRLERARQALDAAIHVTTTAPEGPSAPLVLERVD